MHDVYEIIEIVRHIRLLSNGGGGGGGRKKVC
jgi:hypothetical protein